MNSIRIRIGVVGVGNMGMAHATNLFEKKVKGGVLSAICEMNPQRLERAKDTFGKSVQYFDTMEGILESGLVDALIIATSHYSHPELAVMSLQAGLHVLVEKPIGVYTKAVEELNKVAAESSKVFTIMYNQRTNPVYKKVRELVKGGELGELIRVNWLVTSWFRSQFYYDSGGWRATWEGEGGGVLLNQCPHQIDLLQWICGMPKRVYGFLSYGKYHDIEVEDDVTAYFEYENGATGVFITTTGEAPGTNRLEITGELGKIVVEDDILTFYKNSESAFTFIKTSKQGFEKPQNQKLTINVEGEETGHIGIIEDFIKAIHNKSYCQIAPGSEGINGLTLSNAMHLSSWTQNWVNLPIDSDLFYTILKEKISTSEIKEEKKDIILDIKDSH